MEALLGDTLLVKPDGKTVVSQKTSEALKGAEVVLLQFSASWCGPCQRFTPMLKEFVDSFQKKDQPAPAVVFISSDRDQASFDKYYTHMDWAALPFAERDLKAKLSKKYKVQGIPTVVAVDAKTGATITTEARDGVMQAPNDYPWRPKPFGEVAGDKLIRCGGSTEEYNLKEHLRGKYVGVYFSAHWCPPCKMFTPMLKKTYDTLAAKRHDFEFVFVSSDNSATEFQAYADEMPWTAIPFDNEEARQALGTKYGVEGIPSFVMLNNDEDHTVLSANSRNSVMRDPLGEEFPWLPKPVTDVEEGAEFLNSDPCLVLLQEAAGDSDKGAALDAVTQVAAAEIAAFGDDAVKFMAANEPNGITTQIRQLCSLGKPEHGKKRTLCTGDLCMQVDAASPAAVLLDIPDNGGFYVLEEVVTEKSLREFLKAYHEGTLERKQMARPQ